MQQKVHKAYNDVDMSEQYADRAKMEADCVEVTLNEGDILYHPAGIWHAVKCDSDSISINFSMRSMRLGEFVTQAIQGSLFQSLAQRQFMHFNNKEDLQS